MNKIIQIQKMRELGGKPAEFLRKYLKRPKKAVLIGLITVLCLGSFIFIRAMGGGSDVQESVATAEAARVDLEETVSVTGRIEGAESAEVVSQIDSEIVSILVSPGDAVKKGDVLAVLDGADLAEEAVLARTQYEKAKCDLQAELDRMQREYDSARRLYADEKRKYEAGRSLYSEGAISKNEFISSENSFKAAEAELSSFDAAGGIVRATPSQLKELEMEKEILDQKTAALDSIYIKSPIDGTVTRANAKLGRYASETGDEKAMFVIEDLAHLQMKVKISEYDIGRLEIGQKATISSDVLGSETVEGTVSSISPTGEPKSDSVSEMVVPVTIDITGTSPGLIAGVSAKARVKIAGAEDVLAVPLEAILEDPETGRCNVFVADSDGILKSVEVETGIEGDFLAEIRKGALSEGDSVVLNPSPALTDGLKVVLEGGGE